MPKSRIMILEDEAVIAWDIEAELQSRGVLVTGVVGHIAAARDLIMAGDVTVAILDINVGSENSYGIAKLCRETGIAVIFLTGATGEELPAPEFISWCLHGYHWVLLLPAYIHPGVAPELFEIWLEFR